MAIRHAWLVVLPILVASCHSRGPQTEPEPAGREISSPAPSSPEVSLRNSWILQPDSRQHQYRSSTVSIVTMEAASASLHDSTALTADFTVTVNRDTRGASYAVTIEGLSVKPASRFSVSAVPDLVSPVSMTGRLETGRITLNTQPDCNNQVNSALPTIQRSLVLVPLQLRKGQTWADSTSSTACSGSIPVTLTASRHYRVVGETTSGGHAGILVERLDKTTSAGEGSEGQHRIQLLGEGSGQAQLLIDPVTGALLEVTGTNTTQATVTTSGRSQKFTQVSREQITQR